MTELASELDFSAGLTVPLDSRRRARGQLFQKLRDAIPAAGLLLAGITGVRQGAQGFALGLAITEIGVSAALLLHLARELKAAATGASPVHGGHEGVDRAHLLTAALLAVEIAEHWHVHHRWAGPTILLAVVTLALAFFHGRIARWRSLRLDEEGVHIGGRFFRRFASSWSDLERIEIGDREARLVARNGRSWRIDLADLRNADEVRSALEAARARLGLRATLPAAL